MIDVDAKVNADAAAWAFDRLGEDAPRLVRLELRNLATDRMMEARAKAPGKLRIGWRVEEIGVGRDKTGFVVLPSDKPLYGDKPVARWVNFGTGSKADRRRVKDNNRAHAGQKPQRFLRPVPKKVQKQAVEKALIRAARRAGFDVSGVGW